MFEQLQTINERPEPFSRYTAIDLWADEHTSSKMLAYHLDPSVDVSSRKVGFIDQSAHWIRDRFGLDETKRVVDFGCGPGLYTTRMAASGARVIGVDVSKRSIRFARQLADRLGVRALHVNANYLELDPISHLVASSAERFERVDLITMIMCDFCALGPAQRQQLLATFRECLKPGGAVLLDVYSLAAFEARDEATVYGPQLMDGFWSPDPYFGFLTTFKYDAEKVVLDKYTIVEPERTRVIFNWLQYYDREALVAELEAGGFSVDEVLADVAGGELAPDSPEFAVIARQTG